MQVHWIWLAHRPGVTDRMKSILLEHFSDPEDIYFAEESAFRGISGLTDHALEGLLDKNLTQAEEILDTCDRKGLQILTFSDEHYPQRLKNIADPPIVLYYQGELPDFDNNALIAVVGTRKASPYGLAAAKRMGWQLAKCGGIVVSGMAFGIDGVAMQSALAAGGTVVGVLGCGADVVYPVSNRQLFADTAQFGCILSEFPPGTPPVSWNFPKRNRIMSGLSCGVLVVEAPEKSGALITAHQALEQGRDVFVVPGNIDVDTFVGSNRLLRDGGILASHGWDVLSEYEAQFPDKLHKDDEPVRLPREQSADLPKVAQKPRIPAKKEKSDKKVIDKPKQSSYSDVNKEQPRLSDSEKRIVSAIGATPRLVDDVIAETGMSAAQLLPLLTVLEVRGVIKRLPGRYIALK